MTQKLYRVVEASWQAGKRVEKDIGCAWKPEQAAKAEMRALQQKSTVRKFSVQSQS
jgi:hypothetical protein